MTLLRDIAKEILSMFLADARLTVGILTLVAIVTVLTESHAVDALAGGVSLLIGCLGILVVAARWDGRRRPKA